MTQVTKHWTEHSVKDFLYRIAADFVMQLEEKMKSVPLSKGQLANKLGVTKGRVSQILNNPGNLTLETIIQYSRAVGMKIAIVAYDDDDPNNERGPINSDVFRICWERQNKPVDFWSLKEAQPATMPGKVFISSGLPVAYILPLKGGANQQRAIRSLDFLLDNTLSLSAADRFAGKKETANDEITLKQVSSQDAFAGLGEKQNGTIGS